jgi:Rhodopirellula transposase DDE domain
MIYAESMSNNRILLSSREQAIQVSYEALALHLNERSARVWAASEAKRYGYGGISAVHRATAIDHKTIRKGIQELESEEKLTAERIRNCGGGRKCLTKKHAGIDAEISNAVESSTRGDPESLLLWTSKSTGNLAEVLNEAGYKISQTSVHKMLKAKGYSMQANCKKLEGKQHQDRDKQFIHINTQGKVFQGKNCPVLSIDTKKKENIGNYKNKGQEYSQKGKPIAVNTHDFADKKVGKVSPYGVYDIGRNEGWVSVGISSDTARFAVNSIRTWWYVMGNKIYKDADAIMITADCGGSNSNKTKLWKWELQKLATELNKAIYVCHFPPGTSKWNKIEHKMFSYISMNWRAKPLISRETVVQLIANTKTKSGLSIQAALDENIYEKGVKVSKEDFDSINIKNDTFHGEWNYTIRPQTKVQN